MPRNTENITPQKNNDTTEASVQLLVMHLMQTDELLREMVKIWTTLGLSQKEALITKATRALRLNQAIEALPAMRMVA